MRIIGGAKRGLKLYTPQGVTTRPTMDRARETIINMIINNANFYPHVVDGYVTDVFAGSGAVGLEMLSRGACHCVFYENDHRALHALCTNIKHFATNTHTVKYNALTPSANDCPNVEKKAFDCVFIDAPYTDTSLSQKTVNGFVCTGLIDKNTLVIVQIDRTHTPPEIANFHITKNRRIGGGRLYFYQFIHGEF